MLFGRINVHSMKSFLLYFAFLGYLLYPTSLKADAILVLKDSSEMYRGGRFCWILETDQDKLTATEIINGKHDNRFRANTTDQVDFGISPDRKWYRITVYNTTDADFFMEADKGFIDELTFYSRNADGSIDSVTVGDHYRLDERPIKVNTLIFPLKVKKNELKTIYFSIKTVDPLQFTIHISTLRSFLEFNQKRDVLYGMYFGLAIVMALFNFFIYLSIRDRSYLYYIFYSVLITFCITSWNGYVNVFIYPKHPGINQYFGILLCITIISALLFNMEFLHVKEYSKSLSRIYKLLIWSIAAVAIINLLGVNRNIPYFIQLICVIGSIFTIATAIFVYRKGFTPALYFIIAWGFFIAGALLFILKNLSVLPLNLLTDNAMQMGASAEVILFSIALASKISFYKKEKEKAQEEKVQTLLEKEILITQQNQHLDRKVKERTKELENTNKSLETTLSNLKTTQQQLLHAEKMASIGQLANGLAHEIKNPLNFINNFSDLSIELLEESNSAVESIDHSEELKTMLRKIKEHGQRADNIISRMLLHTSSTWVTRERLDLVKLAMESLDATRISHVQKHPEIQISFLIDNPSHENHFVLAAPSIRSVFSNLLNNSVYAVVKRYEIEKNNKTAYSPQIMIRFERIQKEVKVIFSDNGIGISENDKKKIFLPFFTKKETGEGTGLGLALCYDIIVQGHQGQITFNSQYMQGTEFELILPELNDAD